jgi:hypothetical protein
VKTAANDPVHASVTEFHRGEITNGVLPLRPAGTRDFGAKGGQ